MIQLVHSFARDNFWSQKIDQGFRQELILSIEKNREIVFESVFLPETSIEHIKTSFNKILPDLVILTDDLVAKELMPDLMKRKIPTFFTGINQRINDISWLKDEWRELQTGIIEVSQMSASIRILEKMKNVRPIKKLAIFGGPSLAARNIAAFATQDLRDNLPGVEVSPYIAKNSYEEWEETLPQINKSYDAIILLLPFEVIEKSTGKSVSWKKVGDLLRKIVTIPTIGKGSLNGEIDRLVSFAIPPEKLGKQTAMLVHQFFEGRKISDIRPEYFRFHELQIKMSEVTRLGIELPEDLFGFANLVQ